MIDKDKQHNRD